MARRERSCDRSVERCRCAGRGRRARAPGRARAGGRRSASASSTRPRSSPRPASSRATRSIYGGGGDVDVEQLDDGAAQGLRLTFVDQGPGIADIELALKDGYTTGGGPRPRPGRREAARQRVRDRVDARQGHAGHDHALEDDRADRSSTRRDASQVARGAARPWRSRAAWLDRRRRRGPRRRSWSPRPRPTWSSTPAAASCSCAPLAAGRHRRRRGARARPRAGHAERRRRACATGTRRPAARAPAWARCRGSRRASTSTRSRTRHGRCGSRCWARGRDCRRRRRVRVGASALPMPGEDVVRRRLGRCRQRDGSGRCSSSTGSATARRPRAAAQAALRCRGARRRARPGRAPRVAPRRARTTRGAAAAAATSAPARGNGASSRASATSRPSCTRTTASANLVSHNGTLGHEVRKFQEFEFPLRERRAAGHALRRARRRTGTLDAIRACAARIPALIAGVLYRDHARGRDDVDGRRVRRRREARDEHR